MFSLPQPVAHAALKAVLAATQARNHRALLDASAAPREAQWSALSRILAANAETAFGRQHDFAKIGDVDAFRSAVPVQSYEDLRPLIARQELTGERCLTQAQPVFFHRTSGTTGVPKDIPITQPGLDQIKQHQKIFAYAVSRGSNALRGKMFTVSGQAVEGTMPGGTPYGSASGLLYQSQSGLVRSRYVLPPACSDIPDYSARYLAMATFGVAEAAVTGAATANPSTLVRLLGVINEQPETILRAIADGRLPDAVINHMSGQQTLKPNRPRAQALTQKLSATGKLTYADIWPDLEAVMTWTGGSCGVSLRSLAPSMPAGVRTVELGYVASEVQGTINIDATRNTCLPTLVDTFFEFAEREAWEDGAADFLSLHELEEGADYHVFVTTTDGLYRYAMHDIVRVTGRLNQTPILEFLQKGKGVTSITGEKLYEAQVLDAVTTALADRGIEADFFIMLGDQESAGYTLYVESAPADTDPDLTADIETRLRTINIEYDAKRASERLAPLKVCWLRDGAGAAYRADRVAGGQRDAQFKYLHLQYAHDCAFDFGAYAVAA